MTDGNLSPRHSGYARARRIESWEALYEAAVSESDRTKLRERLSTAVTAIERRLGEIARSDTQEALQCRMALETLKTLRLLELDSA